jgi:hypothetical protein
MVYVHMHKITISGWLVKGDHEYLFLRSGERNKPMADCKRQMLLGPLIEGGRWTTFSRLPKTELQ